MNDTIVIDTTKGGFYLGSTNRNDGNVGFTIDKNDVNGNQVMFIEVKMTPSNAKEIAWYLTELANSILDKSE